MAYVSGFKHDYFISYGVVDDEKEEGVRRGWITAFVTSLEVQLGKAIGRKGRLEPWWDRADLRRNGPLDQQIQSALQDTACLVVILSPGFFESPWCRTELDAFREVAGRQGRGDSRVFVVDQGKLPDEQRMQRFPNYQRFEFFRVDELQKRRLLGFPQPNPEHDRDYYLAINDLAAQLKDELDEIQRADVTATPRIEPPPPVTGDSRPAVYLAEVSDDLVTDRKQVETHLRDHPLRPVCGGRGAIDLAAWKTAATRELENATCVVQLLGQFPGRELNAANKGIVLLQHELAVSLGKRILLWRAPSLLQKGIENQELRSLAMSGGVVECPIEAFKSEIIRFASPPPPPPPVKRLEFGDGALIFIHAGAEDIDQAQTLSGTLAEMNCMSATPLVTGTPEEIREDLEGNLMDCDGLILFYGRITPNWIRAQFRSLQRMLPKRNDLVPPRPLKVAICRARATGKPDLGIKAPGLHWIDLSVGAHREHLSQWVAALRT